MGLFVYGYVIILPYISFFPFVEVVYHIGVSSTKDFHSRIGIFESCRYLTDRRIICLGAWSKYITFDSTDFNTQGKCVTDISQIQTGLNNALF